MRIWSLTAFCACAVFIGAAGLDLEEKDTIRKSWTLANPAQVEVTVDNIDGSIEVSGYAGRDVEMVASRTAKAESEQAMQKAREQVRLDFSQTEGEVRAFVDAPWRCRDGGINYRGERRYGFRVSYDFNLRVPAQVRLFLRTINHGAITVRNVSGDYDIENINGGIEMAEIGGSGRAYALNGAVTVRFNRNPQGPSYYGSLNGDVDLFFLPNLAADLRLKTFNGGIYTDFPVTSLPSSAAKPERRGTKFVYRSNDFFGVRVGAGGPEIKLDGFNGNIRIHESGK
jgi:hypothetical protein